METLLFDTFIAVAGAGSFSAASNILGVTQPVVTRRIRELEKHCHAPVFYRHGRGVKLTLAGELLYQHARTLTEGIASALNAVADANSQPSGVVIVALSPSVMCAIGAPLIDTLAQESPLVRLQLVSGYSGYVLEWLLQARVDIGVLSGAGLSNQLVSEELGCAPIILVAHPELPLPPAAANGEMKFSDLAAIPLIITSHSQGVRRYIDMAAAKAGIELNIICEVDDMALTRELVRAGKGATLISALSVQKDLDSGALVHRVLDAPRLYAHSMLSTAPNRPITPAMKLTIAAIKKVTASVLTQL